MSRSLFRAGAALAGTIAVVACTLARSLDGISGGAKPTDAGPDAPRAEAGAHCSNGALDFDEIAIDCGGRDCVGCPNGTVNCALDRDCASYACDLPSKTCVCQSDQQSAIAPDGGDSRYCVDATEVTNAQYAQMLADCDGGCADWVAACGTLKPAPGDAGGCPSFDPKNNPSRPVVCVSFCQAEAYCALRHKRLCGRYGAGSVPYAESASVTQSEWFNACSRTGQFTYPYGPSNGGFDPTRCNGAVDGGPGAPVEVASLPCQGGFPGIYDMSGNVWEWEDSCLNNVCHLRGGSYASGETQLRCDRTREETTDTVAPDVGLRCCGGF